eukprot:4251372-Prymnesium_polylepis.1
MSCGGHCCSPCGRSHVWRVAAAWGHATRRQSTGSCVFRDIEYRVPCVTTESIRVSVGGVHER